MRGYIHTLVICFVGGGISYLAWVTFRAWWEAKEAPRVDMFTCDKHGAIPSKDVIQVPMDDGGKPYLQCPFCFEDAMKLADKRLRASEAKVTDIKK